MGQSDGSAGLVLASFDGLKSSPDDFRDVGPGVDADGGDAGDHRWNPCAEGQGQTEIDEHDLDHEGGAPDAFDIDLAQAPDDRVSGDLHQPRRGSQEKPQDKAEGGDEDGQFYPGQEDRDRFPHNAELEFKAGAHGSCILFFELKRDAAGR